MYVCVYSGCKSQHGEKCSYFTKSRLIIVSIDITKMFSCSPISYPLTFKYNFISYICQRNPLAVYKYLTKIIKKYNNAKTIYCAHTKQSCSKAWQFHITVPTTMHSQQKTHCWQTCLWQNDPLIHHPLSKCFDFETNWNVNIT